jgi:hypothetical protein
LPVVLYGYETWAHVSELRLIVFENRVLRRICGPKRNVTGEWRRLHNEELHELYLSNIIRVIKSRRMRWAGLVARVETGEVHTEFSWGNLRERDHLKELGLDGRIILKWIFKTWDVEAGTGLIRLRLGTEYGLL